MTEQQLLACEFTEESLEDLCIAILKLRSGNQVQQIFPVHVLQPWILNKLPTHVSIKDVAHIEPSTGA